MRGADEVVVRDGAGAGGAVLLGVDVFEGFFEDVVEGFFEDVVEGFAEVVDDVDDRSGALLSATRPICTPGTGSGSGVVAWTQRTADIAPMRRKPTTAAISFMTISLSGTDDRGVRAR